MGVVMIEEHATDLSDWWRGYDACALGRPKIPKNPTGEMIAAGHRVMQHGLATPADIWDAMYRAAMGEPLESIEPKVKP